MENRDENRGGDSRPQDEVNNAGAQVPPEVAEGMTEESEENRDSGSEGDSYSFMQETIKNESGGGKNLRGQLLKLAGLGLVFGLAASVGFCALKPWADKNFGVKTQKVTIPAEEEEDSEEQTEDQPEQAEPVLTVDSYKEMNRALYGVANQVNRSVVEISAVNSSQGWQSGSYDTKSSVGGVILGDNGVQLLILAKSSVMREAESLTATFADGKVYPAALFKTDGNLGFSVYAVQRNQIQESTWGQIEVAVLGSSNMVSRGDIILALGKPFDYFGSMGVGIISSSKNIVNRTDGEKVLLCTDIAGTKAGSGVLANIDGEIVGLIDQTISDEESMNLTTAYAISDLKSEIQMLLDEQAVPYLGIKGVTVTEELAESQGLVQGIYVQEVQVDSPAMEAGIQSGDIITVLDGSEVKALSGYRSELLKRKPGQKIKIKGQRQGAGEYVNIDFSVTVGSKE